MPKLIREYIADLKREFAGYGRRSLTADLLAGITVAAVALPLALAFGVSSGADASAGLITAIAAALIIGALSGASYQISGPTGAMAAILVPLALRHGLKTVLAAGFLSGIILVAAGLLKVGRVASFLPKSVITGFTSGIALIIALGQVENLLGMQSEGEEAYLRVFNLIRGGGAPNPFALAVGGCVVVLALLWPKKWGAKVPASLLAVILATAAQFVFRFPLATVGDIPQTLIHDTRLSPGDLAVWQPDIILMPALSIAALCMIETLLCGAVAGKMRGEKLKGDRELIAQGIGNMALPFLGGVPATAAIARTSVAVKSGGKTRLTGIIQGVILLLSMFILSPLMSQIPMSALAGVLIVTAWRMNEWENIRYIFRKRFKSAIVKFLATLLCTVIFDLTIAILLGCLLGMLLYIIREADLVVTVSEFDAARLGKDIRIERHVQVIYITGSIFFASSGTLADKLRDANGEALVFSLRGVPDVDVSGVQELLDFCEERLAAGVRLSFCGVQPKVKEFFDRAGLTAAVGAEQFYWEAEDALTKLAKGEP